MSVLAFLLSLVLEHFRPLLGGAARSRAPDPVDALADAPAHAGWHGDGTVADGPGRRAGSGAGGFDGSGAAAGQTGAHATGYREGASPPADEDQSNDELEAELDRLANEIPEPDPFDEPVPESPLPLDAEIAARLKAQNDAGAFVPQEHPWFGPVARLVDWATPEAIDTADTPPMGWAGWSLVLIAPAVALLIVQGFLGNFGWPGLIAVLLLHVWVLYHGVLVGRLHRRLDRLYVLASTGEHEAVRALVGRWVAGEAPLPVLDDRETARLGLALPLLDAYRDIFAPLFWYLLLPGPIGPLVYWCARVSAARRAGVAAAGLRALDWLPARLAAFGFALGGRFDDAIFGLRSSHAAASNAAPLPAAGSAGVAGVSGGPATTETGAVATGIDPASTQRLLLLPAASGALGVDLRDEATCLRLQAAASDVAAEMAPPALDRITSVRSLLFRCAGLWTGIVVVGGLLL